MITKITILSSGNIAPNKVIPLGKQHENVGDILEFDIPTNYKGGYHYYLAFYMKKHDTILLPVNYVDNSLQFVITSTVTRYSGDYEIVFLATERAVVNKNIDDVRKVFVSTTMYGHVEDNFIEDPVIDGELDENLQIIYDELLDLKDEIEEDLETDYYRGATYIPDVSNDGVLSWTRSDEKTISIPEPKNITGPQGPQGPYYKPTVAEGIMSFEGSQEAMPTIETVDMNELVEKATNDYLNANLKPTVNAAVDAKFKFTWDDASQILYITTEEEEML